MTSTVISLVMYCEVFVVKFLVPYLSDCSLYYDASVHLSVCDICALWSQGAMDPGYLCMLG